MTSLPRCTRVSHESASPSTEIVSFLRCRCKISPAPEASLPHSLPLIHAYHGRSPGTISEDLGYVFTRPSICPSSHGTLFASPPCNSAFLYLYKCIASSPCKVGAVPFLVLVSKPSIKMHLLTLFSLLLGCVYSANAVSTSSPIVAVKNGTLRGLHSPEWNQDLFLGIPYAQPPLGDLRFRWPRSVNTTWNGTLDATHYGYSCYQYNTNFNLSEDCLTLNGTSPCLLNQRSISLTISSGSSGRL